VSALDAVPAPIRSRVRDGLARYARLGWVPGDDLELIVRKQTLTIAATTVTVLATGWTALYLALGLPQAAIIPLAYQVVSVISLAVFARSGRFDWFAASQLGLMLVLPFALQWMLGGFVNSSVVSIWAMVAAFGAVYLLPARQAIPWFGAFLALVVLSGLIDPALAAAAPAIPDPIRTSFFVLNVGAVAVVTYMLLQYFVRQREAARAATEALLLNVLPRSIAERLRNGPVVIADAHPDVTVLFADVVDFTPFAERSDPRAVVDMLDGLFSAFDELADRHGLEKIKTIGDAYMVVGGLPQPRRDHAEAIAAMALDMQALAERWTAGGRPVALRIGIDSGPVIAGVIGRRKFIYDLWGDTVNTASRMESHGEPGRIQLSPRAAARLTGRFVTEMRETIPVKGKGWITPSVLIGPRPGPGPEPPGETTARAERPA
jgi:class 3 adenylate cyclase